MTFLSLQEELTDYLYQIDPAFTYCQVNDLTDEYEEEVKEALRKSGNSEDFYKYLNKELIDTFGDRIEVSRIDKDHIKDIFNKWQ